MCLFWGVYLPLNRKWPHLSLKCKRKIIDNLRNLWKVIKLGNGSCSVAQSCLTLCDAWIAARHDVLHHFPPWFSSAQLPGPVWLCDPHRLQLARLPCPSPTPGACSNSCSLSQWCSQTISFFVIPFSPHLQSFSASGSFPMRQFFALGSQSIAVSASASVLPMNIQDWFALGWTGWISLQSKGLSRVFSNTTVQKHQFSDAQLSLLSNSHIHTWLLEKP